VAHAYRETRIPPHITEGRHRRARELLRARRGRHDAGSFQALLRDHGEAGVAWRPGPGVKDEAFFTLCAHSGDVHWTTASLVAPLPADRRAPWPVWISFATPCTGIFLPVYVDGVIPAALAHGGEQPEADSAWWVFKRLQDAVASDWPRHTSSVRAGWAELEEQIEKQRVEVETAAGAAARAGEHDRAALLVSAFMTRALDAALERAEELRARIAA
jgi:secernin